MKESKSSTRQKSKPEIPETVIIEMTPKLYQAMKAFRLKELNPLARSHINTYFEWLKSIRPEEVVDAIELEETPQQAYRKLGANPIRIGIAAVRAFLKTHPQYAAQLREIASLDLALTTLKFENPATYAIIQKYRERGTQFVQDWINGALEILGALPKKEAKA